MATNVKPSGDVVVYKTGLGRDLEARGVFALDGFALPAFDYLAMSYTGSNLTKVEYYAGGSGGTKVATLTLAYDGSSNLTSVTRS